MHDQADQLRKLVRDAVDLRGDLAPGAPLVVVTGARPAVGATTAACGLARELARLGKQVTLVDANFAAPALGVAFDASPLGTIADVLAGTRRAIEIVTPVAENLDLLAGARSGVAVELNAEAFARLHAELASLARQSDAVVVDSGHGMSPWIDRLWQVAHQALLVTTTDATSIVDAYAALKLAHHDRLEGKLQLVVTRCDAGAAAARVHAGLSETCNRFLGHALKPPAILPSLDPADPAAFQRSARVLAADLACEMRTLTARLPARAPVGSRLSAIRQSPAKSASG